jgi:hypothetical protein
VPGFLVPPTSRCSPSVNEVHYIACVVQPLAGLLDEICVRTPRVVAVVNESILRKASVRRVADRAQEEDDADVDEEDGRPLWTCTALLPEGVEGEHEERQVNTL